MDGCTNAILAICITPGKASVFHCFRALVFVVRISNGARERAECSEVCRVLGRVLSEGPPGGARVLAFRRDTRPGSRRPKAGRA